VSAGYLVYGENQNPGAVRALPFDPVSLTPRGSPISLVGSVERAANGGAVYFAVARTGLFLYALTGDRHQLVWVDRNGIATPISPDRAAFRGPRLSPDGTQIAVGINDETRRSDIWIYDAQRGTKRRLTTELHNLSAAWTPDGRRITFSSRGIAELAADASGTREDLLSLEQIRASLPAGTTAYPTSWSPDGRDLLVQADLQGLWRFSRDRTPTLRPVLQEDQFNANSGRFSPNGQWVVYTSNETGRDEIYVRHYPDFANPVVISTEGGTVPLWSHDGRTIFYRRGDAVMVVAVEAGREFRAEKPQRLFAGPFAGAGRDPSFDVSLDGMRFVMVKSDEASALTQLTVVQNLFEELQRGASTATK
jgi:serine/threonine-protein kinase